MADAPPTFSESWYRIANLHISLRAGVRVRRQNYRGQRWFVLENPFNNQFFRLRSSAYEFVARLRPDRTVEQVWQICLGRFPDEAPGQEAVIQLLSQLYFANLLQYDLAADSTKLFERFEKNRQRETRSLLSNLMFMRFPLLDPDEFLGRTMPLIRKLISPIGGLLWILVIGAAIKVVLDNFAGIKEQSQAVLAPNNLFLLYFGLVLVKTIHEFGHAYFCKRFGGEVHVMGVMLMIFTPIPYMDATSAWGFRNRWHRVLVGAAGMIVELFIAALATFVWAKTGPGTIHSLAYNIMFVASVSTILFNINPLLRYDGYYILTDLLEIPNLQQRSSQHLRYLVERYLFGIRKAESPAQDGREAAWYTCFGSLSGIYRVVVFGGILLFVADRFLLIGVIMAIICAISWIVVPLTKLCIYLASNPVLERHRVRAVTVTAGFAVILLLLLEVIPFPYHFRAPGVLKSSEWTEVVNETPGYLETLVARPDAWVKKGQPLIQFKNRQLDLDINSTLANVQEIKARLLQAMSDNAANLKPLTSKLESVRQRLHKLENDRAALLVRARQDGFWVLPQVEEYVGRWLVRGSSLGLIVNTNAFEFTATVSQTDGDRLFKSFEPDAQVRLHGQSGSVLHAGNVKVVPAEQQQLPSAALGWATGGELATAQDDPQGRRAAETFFEVRAEIQPTEGLAMLHGRSGKIRFDLKSEPLLPRWIRTLRQLFQKRYRL